MKLLPAVGPVASAKIEVDGVQLAYHVAGNGPVCVAHPGGPGVHYQYLRMAELEKHLTMVYVEPVGTGGSDLQPDGDYNIEKYAAYSAALIEALGTGPAFFLGHSHGGFVALQLALDHPDLLAGIIVYDSMAFNGKELGDAATLKVEEYAARHAGDPLADQVLTAWRERMAGLPPVKEVLLENRGRLDPVYVKDYPAMKDLLAEWKKTYDLTVDPHRHSDPWDVRDRLHEIAVPALVLVGEYDFICGEKFGRELQVALKDAELVVLHDSGHFGHIEEPELFTSSVLAFTSSHSR
jgi:proline iminopeptidase